MSPGSFGSRLRETSRDDADRLRACPECFSHCREHVLSREADDGEVDGLRYLRDRAEGLDPCHRLALPVHGEGGAREVGFEDVPEELASDRPPPRGGAEDGDRRRLEEGTQGRNDRDVVALRDALGERLRRRDRERDLRLAALERARDLEPGVLEDAHHRRVPGHHHRDEALDALLRRACRELLEQPGSDASALVRVRNRKGDLGRGGIPEPHVVRKSDDLLYAVLSHGANERAAFGPVGVERRLDEAHVEAGVAVEAEIEAVVGEASEEVEERVRVGAQRRSQAKRASVAEDDVD